MTNRASTRRSSQRSAASRAEARRRARLAAQGYEEEEAEDQPEARPSPPREGFLNRLFPAAPPLAGKSDPLAAFDYQGPARTIVAGLYLLWRNPIAWIAAGGLYVLSWEIVLLAGGQDNIVLLVAQVGQYLVLAAAGWFGWQRPWLFGGAAGVVGSAGSVALFGYLSAVLGRDAGVSFLSSGLYFELAFYFVLGAALGWYGGYIRRRLAAPNPNAAATRARRR